MKRRSFLKGAIAAPAVVTIPDLLAGLLDGPAQATPPVQMPDAPSVPTGGARLYIDGIPINGLNSFSMSRSQSHFIEVTSLHSLQRDYRPPAYSDFEAEICLDSGLVGPLHDIAADQRSVEFKVVSSGMAYAFTGYIRQLNLQVDYTDNMIACIDVRANSEITVSESADYGPFSANMLR